MKTTKVIINVDDGHLKVKVQNGKVNFNIFEAMKILKKNSNASN